MLFLSVMDTKGFNDRNKTQPQEFLRKKINIEKEIFGFDVLLHLEGNLWTLGLTKLEKKFSQLKTGEMKNLKFLKRWY